MRWNEWMGTWKEGVLIVLTFVIGGFLLDVLS